MRSVKMMFLGLLIILVGFGFFVILSNINLGIYATLGPVNILVDPFVHQGGGGAFDYLAQVASIIRTEEEIALAIIGAGLLVAIVGCFQKSGPEPSRLST